MSGLDWNDLRTFAEVARGGSLTAAARALGVHPTTIARRMAAAEEALGTPLFLRAGKKLVPAPAGARVLSALDPLVEAVDDVARRASKRDDMPIRIALTENGARQLATFAVPVLLAETPPIEVELLAGNTVIDLSKGQADFALRVMEPTSGDLIRRRLGASYYGLYASAAYLKKAPRVSEGLEGQSIVVAGGELARSPEARYMAEHGGKARVALRCSSLLALAVAAEAGAGLVVLPTNLAIFHTALSLVRYLDEIPARPAWLVMHRDVRKDIRITHTAKIVGDIMSDVLKRSAPNKKSQR